VGRVIEHVAAVPLHPRFQCCAFVGSQARNTCSVPFTQRHELIETYDGRFLGIRSRLLRRLGVRGRLLLRLNGRDDD